MKRVLAYAWLCVVTKLTGWVPDFKFVMRLRGWLIKPCFRRCGRNFQIGAGVTIVYPTHVTIGDDVYLAYGSWIQGYGEVTLEDQVMLGPYTILASNNHTRKDRSYRFGSPRCAPIVLKRGAWTGGHVVVTAGVTVGLGAACAAGAVVTRSVEDDAIVGGVPARVIGTATAEETQT